MTAPATAGRRAWSRVAAGVLALAGLASLTACSSDRPGEADPRALTTDEAQVLAITRFRNFDAGTRPFTATLEAEQGRFELVGWVDWVAGEGYALVTGEGQDSGIVVWSHEQAAAQAAPADIDAPPLPAPTLAQAESDPTWGARPLNVQGNPVDTMLGALLSLGADRPENPLLLQQSGALWLGEDSVDGRDVTVFAAPASEEVVEELPDADDSPLRLWVDDEGTMWRAQVRVTDTWSTIDFEPSDGVTLGGEG